MMREIEKKLNESQSINNEQETQLSELKSTMRKAIEEKQELEAKVQYLQ